MLSRMPKFPKSDWVCDYYLADLHGLTMNKVVAMKHIGFSLHGAWNKIGNSTEPCMDYETFQTIYHRKFLEVNWYIL